MNTAYDLAPREPAPAPVPDPEEAIAPLKRKCPNCGFGVTGKTLRNRCPECAGDLNASTEFFQFNSARWIHGLIVGILFLMGSLSLDCFALASSWIRDGNTVGARQYVLGGILAFVGTWLISTHDSASGVQPFPMAVPARLTAFLYTVAAVALLAADSRVLPLSPSAILCLFLVSLAIYSALLALQLRSLAHRIPNDSLVWWSQSLAWILPICILAHLMLHISPDSKAEFLMLFTCAMPMAGGFGVMAILSLVTLMRFALEFCNCAAAANDILARHARRAAREAQRLTPTMGEV